MSRLSRITQKLFASNPGSDQVGQFGSFAASSIDYTTDPAAIQALAAWTTGWYAAIVGQDSPAIQDMNGFCLVVVRQLANIFQDGVPLWDAGTTYYEGSICQKSGVVYTSLTDTNLNNDPASTYGTDWVGSLLGAGSLTNPPLAFAADPTTGLYSPSTGALEAVVSGVVQALFSSVGLTLATALISPQATIGPSGAPAFKMKRFTGTNVAANTTILIGTGSYTVFYGAIGTTSTSGSSGENVPLGTGFPSGSANNTIGNQVWEGSPDGGIIVRNSDTAVSNTYNVTLFYA